MIAQLNQWLGLIAVIVLTALSGLTAVCEEPLDLVQAIQSNDPDKISSIIDARKPGAPVTKELLEGFSKALASEREDVRQAAIDVICRSIKGEAKPINASVLSLYKDKNQNIRKMTLYALGVIHADPDSTLPVLEEALTEQDEDVKSAAILAIAEFSTGAKRSGPRVAAVLEDPKCPNLREQVFECLWMIKAEGAEVMGTLMTCLEQAQSKEVRDRCSDFLTNLSTKPQADQINRILDLVASKDVEIRSRAANVFESWFKRSEDTERLLRDRMLNKDPKAALIFVQFVYADGFGTPLIKDALEELQHSKDRAINFEANRALDRLARKY